MFPLPYPFQLRPVRDDDQSFVDMLYDSTRADLKEIAVDHAVVGQLIKMQQQMQSRVFQADFPGAHYLILMRGDDRIGRLVIDLGAKTLHMVDLALCPTARCQGGGTVVLRALQEWAAGRGLIVALSVSHGNPAARRLYHALGFELSEDDAVQAQLRWRPDTAADDARAHWQHRAAGESGGATRHLTGK
ncbi:MAG: GNAT family N-acetyltransferase [Pseudomonadota bacterium]